MNRMPNTASSTPTMTLSVTTLPSTRCAICGSRCPSLTEMSVEPPTPTIAPKAAERFMMGKVTARPDRASEPSALVPICPMKIRSTML